MKIKFKVSIGATTASIILISTIIIISYNYFTSREIIYDMSNEILKGHSKNISHKLKGFLKPANYQTMFLSDMLNDKNYIKNGKREEYLELMWKYMNMYPQVAFVYISDKDGNWTQVRKKPWLATRLINRETNEEIWEQRNKNYDLINRSTNKANYDHRVREWYKNIKPKKQAYWSAPYVFQSIRKPGITVSYPLHDKETNEHFGAISADITLDDISAFLKREKVYDTELSYIVNEEGVIIAYSDIDLSSSGYRLINTDIRDLNNHVGKAFDLIENRVRGITFFTYNNKKYLSKLTNISIDSGRYRLITVVKQSEVFGEIIATLKNSIMISVLILLIALFVLVRLINKISNSIQELTKDADKLTHLNFYNKISESSRIYEIHLMQTSLEALRKAMQSFSKYVPFHLVEKMIENQIEAKLGGEKKEITLMFTDIANFTTISDEKDADELVGQLTEYFSEISEIVNYTGGIIDKFIGDGTMSFWGAPVESDNNAAKACEAALACRECITILNERWSEEEKPLFKTRIGINTGETIVGNVGSSKRMNYTAMGDSVNITARLEALCKTYEVDIIISEATYTKIKDEFYCRPLGYASLKGKKDKMMVYQLVEKMEIAREHPEYHMHEEFLASYLAYINGDIKEVFYKLTKFIEKYPHDKPATIFYLEVQKNFG